MVNLVELEACDLPRSRMAANMKIKGQRFRLMEARCMVDDAR